MNVNPEHKRKIIGIVSVLFPNATIYLFGSRARGTHTERSDIDIAIDTGSIIEPADIGEARDMLAQSNIPYKIDVVDFNCITKEMRQFILKEGIKWKE